MIDSIVIHASHDAAWFWYTVVLPSAWSGFLTALGIGGWLLVALKVRIGWLVNIVNQALWVAYGHAVHQYFFYVSAAFLSTVFIIGFWNAGRKGRLRSWVRARLHRSTPVRAKAA